MRALRGVVDTALAKHSFPQKEPVRFSYEATRDHQFSFYGNDLKTAPLGSFYDAVTAALYGGEVVGNSPIQIHGFNVGQPFRADIVNSESREVRESKACNSTHTLVLKDAQRINYLCAQAVSPHWRVSYSIYRHGVAHILSYPGTEHDLYCDLAKQTAFSVSLPASVIDALGSPHRFPKTGERDPPLITSRCTGYSEIPPSTRVNSTFINLLFSNTRDALRKIQLDPSRYTIQRYKTHPGLHIKNRPHEDKSLVETYFVKPFLVVELIDKRHTSWVRAFGRKLARNEGCSDDLESKVTDDKLTRVLSAGEIPF